jgi:hypothetical protein
MTKAAHAPSKFMVIDQNQVNSAWNGIPTTLQVNQNVNMPQTANGTMILAAQNNATQNNQGVLSITSGGSVPTFLNLQANANQPSIVTNNWKANNLSLTNVSPNLSTPVWIQAVGPGIPGINPRALDIGTPLELNSGEVAQGNASPQWLQLVVQSNTPTLGIIGIIGGPQDDKGNNGYVIAVNAASNTPPPGYYAATTSNVYTFQFNWGSSLVFVANLSPATASLLKVTLRAL